MSEVGPDSTDNPESTPTDAGRRERLRACRRPRRRGRAGRQGRGPAPTTPARSPSSRASRRCASAPACTSARPVSAACTTWSGRSSTTRSTRRWPATPTPSTSPSWPTAASGSSTTAAASPPTSTRPRASPAVEVVLTQLHAGGKFGGGGYAVSGGLHGVGISVVNALSDRLDVEVRQQGHVFRHDLRRRRARRRPLDAERGDRRDRHDDHLLGQPDIFETVDYDFETLRARFQQMAFLNKGLTINLTDERPEATEAERDADGMRRRAGRRRPTRSPRRRRPSRAPVVLPLRRRPGRLRQAPQRLQARRAGAPRGHRLRGRGHRAARSSLELAMQWTNAYSESVHTYANTINTHEGGTHEEGFRAAMTKLVNDFAREQEPPQGEGREPHRRRRPRGPDRGHLGQARRAAVRGPDQDQARQLRGQGLRPAGRDRRARPLARAPTPARAATSSARRSRPPRRGWRPARPARRPAARACSSPAACPASSRDCQSKDPVDLRGLHRRGRLAPAARPCAAATRTPRRSCRSAARSSTSRRPASTGCSANNEVQALISGLRHRHRRGLRPRQGALPQDRADGRRRRRRPCTSAPCC